MKHTAILSRRFLFTSPRRGLLSAVQNLPYFTRLTRSEEGRKASESVLRDAFAAAASELDGPIPDAQSEEAAELWRRLGLTDAAEAPRLRSVGSLLQDLESHIEAKRTALHQLVEPTTPAIGASAHFLVRCLTLKEVLTQLVRGVARAAQKESDRSFFSFASRQLPTTVIDEDKELLAQFCRAWVHGTAMDRIRVHLDAILKTSESEWLPEAKALLAFETVYYGLTHGLIGSFNAVEAAPRRQKRLYQRALRNYLRYDVEFPMKFRCCFAWAAADDPHPAVREKPSLDPLARKEALLNAAESQFLEEFSHASRELQEEFKRKEEKYWTSRVDNRQYYGLSFVFLSAIFMLDLYSMDL